MSYDRGPSSLIGYGTEGRRAFWDYRQWAHVPVEETRVAASDGFVGEVEARLRQALTGALGSEIGRDAAAEALAYGWEHWSRVREMENPAGYLYRVGLNWGRKRCGRRPVALPSPPLEKIPWVEPGLPKALGHLSEKQRIAVYLVYGHEWSLSEVAEWMGVSKATVQTHTERGMRRLRRDLKVMT